MNKIKSRRSFLKYLGVSSAGVAVVGAAQSVKEKTKSGVEITKAEFDKLRDDFEKLDKKNQLILKLILFTTGLDLFI